MLLSLSSFHVFYLRRRVAVFGIVYRSSQESDLDFCGSFFVVGVAVFFSRGAVFCLVVQLWCLSCLFLCFGVKKIPLTSEGVIFEKELSCDVRLFFFSQVFIASSPFRCDDTFYHRRLFLSSSFLKVFIFGG